MSEINTVLVSEVHQLHSQMCEGLADPTRILILSSLAESPRNVGDLAEALGTLQPTISRHLKVLRERGMVIAERIGPAVRYSLADHRIIEALDLLRAVMRDMYDRRAAAVNRAD